MPIRFTCPKCRRLLAALEQKAGQMVACPGCQAKILVPTASEGGPETNVSGTAAHPGTPIPSPPPLRAASPEAERTCTTGGIFISRRVIVLQALLLAVVAVGALAAGYFMGGGRAATDPVRPSTDPIVITGRITLKNASGTTPDEGAAILVLPSWRRPRGLSKPDGRLLHPAAPSPTETDPWLTAVVDFGGAYARADADGGFRIPLPQPGEYHVLIVSKAATRTGDFERADLATIGDYIADPMNLLGQQAYSIETIDLASDSRVARQFTW